MTRRRTLRPARTPGRLRPAFTEIRCTCRAAAGALHSICCLISAATQPHAMIDDDGDVYYPDNPDDAQHFADAYGARMLDPTAGAAWLASFTDPPAPGTHPPVRAVRPVGTHLAGGRGHLDAEATG